jgi:MFS family permease
MTAAMLATNLPGFVVALALLGGANSLTFVCDPSMSIEFAPPGRTSVYLGTTLTVLAPFFIIGPLVVGIVIPLTGAPAVFAVSALLAMVGGVLATRVREPRRAAETDTPIPRQPEEAEQ